VYGNFSLRYSQRNLYLFGQRLWQLNDTIQSKIIALAFSMAAEIERDLISQRTKEALQFKKEQGMKLGRPKGMGKSKLDVFRPVVKVCWRMVQLRNLLPNATKRQKQIYIIGSKKII
jgi:DNA invertase Pin-like site-specific DNA recombinase